MTQQWRQLVSDTDRQLVGYTYDPLMGRGETMVDYLAGTARTTDYDYDEYGRMDTVTRPNGIATVTDFDDTNGRVSTIGHLDVTSEDDTPLIDLAYTHYLRGAGGRRPPDLSNPVRHRRKSGSGAPVARRFLEEDPEHTAREGPARRASIGGLEAPRQAIIIS
ncbi:MAG TPA: hypothetical protein VGA13_04510 [Acidimicrobiales bacterium]